MFKTLLEDIKTELLDEFDQNFERKSFFDDPKWDDVKHPNHTGSLMLRNGDLRRSLHAEIKGNQIEFSSDLPYADIHNNGGKITVTKKMKAFFWYKYKEATSSMKFSKKTGKMYSNNKNKRLSQEAQKWKSLALMKEGKKIEMPKRQFIGHHKKVDEIITDIFLNLKFDNP